MILSSALLLALVVPMTHNSKSAISMMAQITQDTFHNILPSSRLGISHTNLSSYRSSTPPPPRADNKKYFTLVLLTESSQRRILLGLKNRGFGSGFYNSFGGKLEASDECPGDGAVRELREETGLNVPLDVMKRSYVGKLNFTFDDDDKMMVIYLHRVEITTTSMSGENGSSTDIFRVDPKSVIECEEITPFWFEDWYDIPLHQMFADDSIWLTKLLTSVQPITLEGYFHYQAGGTSTNTILHHYLQIKPKKQRATQHDDKNQSALTLERKLFHSLHQRKITSIKEFKECWAFANTVRSFFLQKKTNTTTFTTTTRTPRFDLVLDVAGGHGALAALFLMLTSAQRAVVIDPAPIPDEGVREAWGHFFQGKELEYKRTCLRVGLPEELDGALSLQSSSTTITTRFNILVLACHACQHLTDETLRIAKRYGVHVAVMPCCQKDHDGRWKALSKSANLNFALVMDLLVAGKMMAGNNNDDDDGGSGGSQHNYDYDVKIKLIDDAITPQNRVIMCKARGMEEKTNDVIKNRVEKAHSKLQKAYKRAHHVIDDDKASIQGKRRSGLCLTSTLIGILLGCLLSSLYSSLFYAFPRIL